MSETTSKPSTQKQRRWFRFSIRGLLLSFLVLSALFAWLGKPLFRSRMERSVIRDITAAGGDILRWS